jgi:hypothetical protein
MTERVTIDLAPLALGRWLAVTLALAAGCGGTGLGASTRADITARMTSAQQPLESCYQAALQHDRKLQGMIVLAFVAAPQTGQFQEITVTHDELNDAGVRTCVIEQVSKLKLDKPQSSRVSISYPIRFAPNH